MEETFRNLFQQDEFGGQVSFTGLIEITSGKKWMIKTESPKKIPNKKRIGLLLFAVLILVSIIVLSHVFISLLILKEEVDIIGSTLQIDDNSIPDYILVSVDAYLYNPGGSRRTIVWAEITNQATNVSFSKTESVQLDYKQSIKLTFDFTLDTLSYSGEFDHRVWLTYPSSED